MSFLFGGKREKKIKKVKDKPIAAFWKDFEDRADLYFDILTKEEEDSDDFEWLSGVLTRALRRCAPDAECAFGIRFDKMRDPVRLVFECRGDAYLRAVGERLTALYPEAIGRRMQFLVID